tara:strand:+ start:625 stop:1098 length:474 start_codon:yes stop_codon:yes gene_type:complete
MPSADYCFPACVRPFSGCPETSEATRMSGITLSAPIAPGELIDKITILEIKSERIEDPAKLANVETELKTLSATRDRHIGASDEMTALTASLKSINEELWVIEDDIRDCERNGDFGETFIRLARAVYRTNDRRADVKKQINILLGSSLVEEKSYAAY